MSRLRVATVRCDPLRFVRLARGLLSCPADEPTLLLAPLEGRAVALGRFQRAESALDLARARAQRLPVVRRLGGGRSLLVGEGTLGLLLVVPAGVTLTGTPFAADRVVNRYVRGLLAGLRRAGARSAAYFGRDFVSAESRRIAAVAPEGTEEGATALEALVAVGRSLALPEGLSRYPEHSDPRASGPPDASLAEIALRPVAPEEAAASIAAGYAAAHGVETAALEESLAEAEALPVEEAEEGFAPSGLADVPIGFAEALVRHDGSRVVLARLRGDFAAPAFALEALERDLSGCPLDGRQIGERVDAAFRRPGAAILGLRGLSVLAEAVLAAAGRLR